MAIHVFGILRPPFQMAAALLMLIENIAGSRGPVSACQFSRPDHMPEGIRWPVLSSRKLRFLGSFVGRSNGEALILANS